MAIIESGFYAGAAGIPELYAGAAGVPQLYAGAAGLGFVPLKTLAYTCPRFGICTQADQVAFMKAGAGMFEAYCKEYLEKYMGKGCRGEWPKDHYDEFILRKREHYAKTIGFKPGGGKGDNTMMYAALGVGLVALIFFTMKK